MPDRIHYNGSDAWKKKATDVINSIEGGGGGGLVDDVKVNGTSVVANKIAEIDLTDYTTDVDVSSMISTELSNYDDCIQDEYYNKTAVDTALNLKADKSTTYTKTEVDNALSSKANASSVYTKTEADTLLSAKADSTDVYTKLETYSDSEIDTLLSGKLDTSLKGANSGLAELDANGKVPSSQLPSYVDDVIEVANYSSLPATGETGKIYVTTDDNKTYRWSGSAYVEISPSLALGETSSTAYRGDRGKVAYDHATETKAGQTATGLYKVGSTAEGHIAELSAVTKSDITALGIPAQDTTYNTATQSASGLMSSTDKTKLDGIASGAEINVQSDWSQSDNTADDFIKNKPTLATVATSGSYNDLSDTPTIPIVNNGTLTIKNGNQTKGTFAANQSSASNVVILPFDITGNTTVGFTPIYPS